MMESYRKRERKVLHFFTHDDTCTSYTEERQNVGAVRIPPVPCYEYSSDEEDVLVCRHGEFSEHGESDSYEESSDEDTENEPPRKIARIRLEYRKGRVREKRNPLNPIHLKNDNTSLDCCENECFRRFQDLGSDSVQSCREEFHRMKRSQQTDFIFCQIRGSFVKGGKMMYFVVAGRRVCETAWKKIYNIKDRRYRQIKRKVKDDPMTPIDATEGRQEQKFLSPLHIEARNFITDLAGRCGDYQPDFEEIHLPCSYSKSSVYDEYVTAMEKQNQHFTTKSYFLLIWRQHLPNIKIRKFQRFSKCQECTNFRDALTTKLCKEQRLLLFEQRRIHLKVQEIARQKYYKHRSKSRTSPCRYSSLIIDNMDSGKTNLPRFKSEFTLSHIQHHVTGVLHHGRNLSYIFTWTDEFTSDCNITLNCLMSVLEDTAKDNGGCLPPVLYLQADNSAKDNKISLFCHF